MCWICVVRKIAFQKRIKSPVPRASRSGDKQPSTLVSSASWAPRLLAPPSFPTFLFQIIEIGNCWHAAPSVILVYGTLPTYHVTC